MKTSIFLGKKAQAGMSDTVIFIGITIIFVVFGAILPYIQADLEHSTVESNNLNVFLFKGANATPTYGDALRCEMQGGKTSAECVSGTNANNTPTLLDAIPSIISMFFWSFSLPVWANLIIEIFRIILYVIGYRMIRGIG